MRKGLLIALALSCATSIRGDPPEIRAVSPLALRPGEEVELTFEGDGVGSATVLWIDHPRAPGELRGVRAEIASSDARRAVFRVSVPEDLAPGVLGVRLTGPEGVSNLRVLAIDTLASVPRAGEPDSPERAQEVAPPIAIDGRSRGDRFDFFRFHAAKDQRLAVEVLAGRIASEFDPVLRLFDAEGRELAYADDVTGIGPDARLLWFAPEDGDYVIELRDAIYRDGADSFYRLRIGDFPFATSTYPPAVRRGETTRVEIAGEHVEGIAPREIDARDAEAGSILSIAVSFDPAGGSTAVRCLVCESEERLETEPNDSAERANEVELPAALNGRLAAPRDRDLWRFAARKGERWRFTGETRRLGSPTDLYLRLRAEDSAVIEKAEDDGAREGVLEVKIPADGAYLLEVEDLHRRGGPEHVYRVVAERAGPQLWLEAERDTYNISEGSELEVKVTCERRGFDEAITFRVEAPAGVEVEGGIEKGKNEGVARLRLSDEPARELAKRGSVFEIDLRGRAELGESFVEAPVACAAAVGKRFPAGWSVPSFLGDRITLGVVGAPPH